MWKGSGRRIVLTLISAVILLISVTTAWILNTEIQKYRFIQVDFREEYKLRIASTDITVEFWYFDKTIDDYVRAESVVELNGMVPNEMIPFKFLIWNTSGASQQLTLLMTDIEKTDSENPDVSIMEKMYVGIEGGHGYVDSAYEDIVLPENKFLCFSDAKKSASSGKYDLNLYNNLVVPPTGEEYVELKGYFWFNRDATLEFSGLSILIEHFRVIL